MNTARLLMVALAALTPLSCGKPAEGGPASGSGSAGGGRGGRGAGTVAVEVATARQTSVEDVIQGTGQIEAEQAIELRPEVEGRIVEILFREGARVRRGEPLLKVDDSELRMQVTRAEAERDLAVQALERTRQLAQGQASTASDLERAEASARAAEAALALLSLRLERTTVRAPFSGVLGVRTVSLGDFVNNNSRLVTLQTWDPQRAALAVPERYAERLQVGQRLTLRVAALRDREYSGVVDFVDPVVRLPARTILVKARVANPRGELQAGMFIEGRLVAAVRDRAVVVPEDAVQPMQGANLMWVVIDGKATRRQVELGVRMPGFVEITSGVEPGEMVVVGGQERLSEGAGVVPTEVRRPHPGDSARN